MGQRGVAGYSTTFQAARRPLCENRVGCTKDLFLLDDGEWPGRKQPCTGLFARTGERRMGVSSFQGTHSGASPPSHLTHAQSFFWSENPSESVIVGRPTTLPFSLPCVRLTRSFIRKGQPRLQTDTCGLRSEE